MHVFQLDLIFIFIFSPCCGQEQLRDVAVLAWYVNHQGREDV